MSLGGPRVALALEGRSEARFDGQTYDVLGPSPDAVIQRRRATYRLGFEVWRPPALRPSEPTLRLRVNLRLDTDFGVLGAEQDERSSRFVPGLEPSRFDVMEAYVEGRRYLNGVLGFRLGRQVLSDSLGFWAFDGGRLDIETGAHLGLSGYLGFEERLSTYWGATARYERDGVIRLDRRQLEPDQYPEVLGDTSLAPAFGFAARTQDLGPVSARIDYRRVVSRGSVTIDPLGDISDPLDPALYGDERISSERLGGALAVTSDVFHLTSSLVYDILVGLPSQYAISGDVPVDERTIVGAHYDYFLPTFDGDSIFNWFSHYGLRRALLRTRMIVDERFSFSARGGAHLYSDESESDRGLGSVSDPEIAAVDGVGAFDGRYRWTTGDAALGALAEVGGQGRRIGGDLVLRESFAGGFYDVYGSIAVDEFADPLREDRDAVSFTYVLGAFMNPRALTVVATRLGAEWEHSMNRLVGQQFRGVLTARVMWLP